MYRGTGSELSTGKFFSEEEQVDANMDGISLKCLTIALFMSTVLDLTSGLNGPAAMNRSSVEYYHGRIRHDIQDELITILHGVFDMYIFTKLTSTVEFASIPKTVRSTWREFSGLVLTSVIVTLQHAGVTCGERSRAFTFTFTWKHICARGRSDASRAVAGPFEQKLA